MQGSPATPAGAPAGSWRPWTVVLPGVLALLWCALLILADGAAGIMASWDTPAPGVRWITAGLVGHSILGLASVALLVLGLSVPPRRRASAIGAWLIIPVGFGWLLLMGRLTGGS